MVSGLTFAVEMLLYLLSRRNEALERDGGLQLVFFFSIMLALCAAVACLDSYPFYRSL